MSDIVNSLDAARASASMYMNSGLSSKLSKLEQTSSAVSAESTDEELMEACKEFEAYFIEMVMKEMKKMVPENDITDPTTKQLTDYFKESMMSEYASDMAENGTLGLAQTLYEQMKVNVGERIPPETL